ncbi:MAG TPA: OmpA family protein [Longimicrobium sp.]
MSLELTVHGPRLAGAAPFWTADRSVLLEAAPLDDDEVQKLFDYRAVFITRDAVPVASPAQAHVPRSFAARLGIREAKLSCPGLGADLGWTGQGEPAPLWTLQGVLQAHPGDWKTQDANVIPRFVLAEGVLPLDGLDFKGAESPPWERIFGDVVVAAAAAGHPPPDPFVRRAALMPAGLGFEARVRFPWQDAPVAARWVVSPARGASGEVPAWRMAPDRAALDSDERAALRAAFAVLASALQPDLPRASGAAEPRPRWVSLELAAGDDGIPEFFWQPVKWTGSGAARRLEWELVFERTATRLVVESAGTAAAPVATVGVRARTRPGRDPGTPLRLAVDARSAAPAAPGDRSTAAYEAKRAGSGWTEEWTMRGVDTGLDALETAAWLRLRQGRATPAARRRESGAGAEPPFEAPPLWGFAPLEDGWAQLPFLNLTDEVYAAAGLGPSGQPSGPPAEPAAALFSSPALYGNGVQDVSRPPRASCTVAMLDAGAVEGSIRLDLGAAGSAYLEVSLTFSRISAQFNGFLHLAADPPTSRDALPDPVDWARAVRTVPLRTRTAADLFPSPYRFEFDQLVVKRDGLEARPGTWTLAVSDAPAMATLAKQVALPVRPVPGEGERFAPVEPVVWRRHPRLPMAQALPLTQNAQPPSHPSSSRQLAPFILPVQGDPAGGPRPEGIVPAGREWRFQVSGDGDAAWPTVNGALEHAREWAVHGSGLPLAVLSLPGVAAVPGAQTRLDEAPKLPTPFLPLAYRHDLPALDELNALATAPREADDRKRSPLLPPPVKVKGREDPLGRDELGGWWAELAEKAFLAAADAVDAGPDGSGNLLHVVEPLPWPVQATVDSRWPGVLRLQDGNEAGAEAMELRADPAPGGFTALRGVHGRFGVDGEGTAGDRLRLLGDGDAGARLQLTAGAMHARFDPGRGGLRDQRGLWRGTPDVAGDRFVVTPVRFEGTTAGAQDDTQAELWSLLRPLEMTAAGSAWRLWFRDLPMRPGAAGERDFSRARAAAPDMDVNDPAASTPAKSWQTGYEWRLGGATVEGGGAGVSGDAGDDHPHLELLGLHVYPLTLDAVTVLAGEVQGVRITARLQLPVRDGSDGPPRALEQTHLSNAVRLAFSRQGDALRLSEVSVPDGGEVVWPLRLGAAQGGGNARFRWKGAAYDTGRETLTISAGAVEFEMFGVRSTLLLGDRKLVFQKAGGPAKLPVPWTFTVPAGVTKVDMALDPATGTHSLVASLLFEWGQPDGLRVRATRDWPIVGTASGGLSATLVHGPGDREKRLVVDPASGTEGSGLAERSVRVQWKGIEGIGGKDPLHFFPGMELAGATGCAVLWFDVAPGATNSPPAFTVRGGFAEGLFVCAWGRPLTGPSDEKTRLETAFRSSAGHLHVDWTVERRPAGWHPGYLLNGWVEVRNLVSWPDSLAVTAPRRTVGGFPHNGTDLVTEEQREALRSLAREMVEHPGLTVEVEGHGSAVDTLEDNLKVARRRAEAVRRFLEANGVKRRRIDIASLGNARTLERMPDESEEAWHARCRRVELFVRARATFPPTLGEERFDHTRHALRILLNQHTVPAAALRPGTSALLDFGTGAWQFLAVTEHVLAGVKVIRTGDAVAVEEIGEIAAWSAVQEVRWCGRRALLGLVDRILNGSGVADDMKAVTLAMKVRIATVLRDGVGWQHADVCRMLSTGSGLEDRALDDALLVEAGAALWLSPRADGAAAANEGWTVLQHLPDSVLRARLAAPEDFYENQSPYDERGRRVRGGPWHFVALPFLGRVQPGKMDHLETPVPDAAGALQCDPVLLAASRAASAEPPGTRLRLVLHLTCRAWNAPAEVVMHELDLRRSYRLDPGSLGVALQRMREPAREPLVREEVAGLAGVMSARAEATPSLAASPAALAAAFSPHRDGRVEPEPGAADRLVWRPGAMLALQGLVTGSGDTHGFALCAAQVQEALRRDGKEPSSARAVAAATLLPGDVESGRGDKERFPVAFALSPFRRVGGEAVDAGDAETFVSYAEVLAPPSSPEAGASAPSERLRRVGARAWRREPGRRPPDWAEWARELCAATIPEAPFALVRVREVQGISGGVRAGRLPSEFVVAYSFLVVALGGAPATAAAGGSLRSPVQGLRFREGQFGGFAVPGALRPVEVAPPQVSGVQPVWTTSAPSDDAEGAHHRHLSALRFALRYYDGAVDGGGAEGAPGGIVGRPLDPADGEGEAWWAAASLQVQWRPGTAGRLELPPRFRARAVGAFLPAPPGLPLPALRTLAQPAEDPALAWQPVLPHGGRVLDTGARPGVPFLFRHSLLTQRGGGTHEMASGAVPVQHRSPRPVPLPPNAGDPARDHQPAAAWFASRENCFVDREPADNVVLAPAEGGGEALTFLAFPAGTASVPRTRAGLIAAEGAGEIVLEIGFSRQEPDGGWTRVARTGAATEWSLDAQQGTGPALWISDGRRLLALGRVDASTGEVAAPPVENPLPGALRLRPLLGDDAAWRNWAGDLPHGAPLTLGIAVRRAGTGGLTFRQQLRLPLVLARAGFDLAPLRPAFVQFEDPAYNQRLASAPLQKAGQLLVPAEQEAKVLRRAVVASDRQEYDPQAELILAARVDSEKGFPGSATVTKHVLLLRVDRFGGTTVLRFGPDQPKNLRLQVAVFGLKEQDPAGDVLRFSLAPLGLEPGDTLRVMIVDGDGDTDREAEMELAVPIVAQPVVPVPEAAYALLRLDGQGETAVASCARFAWSPQPSRIDILDPGDLFGRQVRRRAVFRWEDYPAFERSLRWRVQKITHTGATHIPAFEGSSATDADP